MKKGQCGRFIPQTRLTSHWSGPASQPLPGVVWAAARITTLVAPLGTTTQIVDGVYEVTADTIRVVAPLSPLKANSRWWFTGNDCGGQRYIEDGTTSYAGFIIYDPSNGQRVYTTSPGGGFTARSQSVDGACTGVNFNVSKQGQPVEATSVTGILDRYNALNVGTFVVPFDVHALYGP